MTQYHSIRSLCIALLLCFSALTPSYGEIPLLDIEGLSPPKEQPATTMPVVLTKIPEPTPLATTFIMPSKATNKPEVNFKPYVAKLQRRIRSHWHIPPNLYRYPGSPDTLRTVILFKIDKLGQMSELKFQLASPNDQYNKTCLAAAQSSAPFKPLPEKFTGKSISVQFVFDAAKPVPTVPMPIFSMNRSFQF